MIIYHVKLTRMKLCGVLIEPVDEEIWLFSSKKKAKKWLVRNGFVYGQRLFINYEPKDTKEWFHQDDIAMEHIDVEITEIDVDDMSESDYKYLNRMHEEWLPKFLSEM